MKKKERDFLLEKIEEWQKKAQCEEDPFNRYVSTFIAYNIFYNLYKKTKDPKADLTFRDSSRAIETQFLIKEDQLFRTLKPDLKEYIKYIPIYREEYWNRQRKVAIRAALAKAYHENNAKKVIEMLLKWLYKVRCNLVHGEKNYDDRRQQILLARSSSLLERILQHVMESYRQLYVFEKEKAVFD